MTDESIIDYCRLYLLDCLKQSNDNINYFNDHESGLRKYAGFTYKELGKKIGMAAQSLNRCENNSSFTLSKKKDLMKEFLSKAIELKNAGDSFLYDYIHSNFHFYAYAPEIPIFESDYIIKTITRNIGNFRIIMQKNQKEMAEILGISKAEVVYYENYKHKTTVMPLEENQVDNVIKSLFDFLSKKNENSSNNDYELKLHMIAGLFLDLAHANTDESFSNDRSILQELINDYCIAQRYKQSDQTINFIKANIEVLAKKMTYTAIQNMNQNKK